MFPKTAPPLLPDTFPVYTVTVTGEATVTVDPPPPPLHPFVMLSPPMVI